MQVNWGDFSEVVSAHLGMQPNELTAQTNIYQDLGIDSLGVVSLGLVVQKHFQVQIPLAALAGVSTLGAMHALIQG